MNKIYLFSWCLVTVGVLCLFPIVPWVGEYVSMLFQGHTHLHFDSYNDTKAADLLTTKHALDNDLA